MNNAITIEYGPWSLFPCKWLCHKYHILLRWTPLSTHLLIQVWWRIHFSVFLVLSLSPSLSLSVFLLLSLLNLWRRSDELKTPSDENSESLALYTLTQIGAQSSRLGYIWGVPPIPILVPGVHMVSELDFDWLLIFVYKWDVWVWIVTLSCPLSTHERHET